MIPLVSLRLELFPPFLGPSSPNRLGLSTGHLDSPDLISGEFIEHTLDPVFQIRSVLYLFPDQSQCIGAFHSNFIAEAIGWRIVYVVDQLIDD